MLFYILKKYRNRSIIFAYFCYQLHNFHLLEKDRCHGDSIAIVQKNSLNYLSPKECWVIEYCLGTYSLLVMFAP